MVYWTIEVRGVRNEVTRNATGPTPETIARLIQLTDEQSPPAGPRNRALVRLLFDLGLRVAEVVRLDLADVDLKASTIWILGKGRTRKQLFHLPTPTVEAIRGWLSVRGSHPGPLLYSYSRGRGRDLRLVTRGAYRIVRNLGAQLGIHLHPHQLRHSAITQAVEASTTTGMSLDEVREFSRHKRIDTLHVYRDRLRNRQAQLATAVAETVARRKDGSTAGQNRTLRLTLEPDNA